MLSSFWTQFEPGLKMTQAKAHLLRRTLLGGEGLKGRVNALGMEGNWSWLSSSAVLKFKETTLNLFFSFLPCLIVTQGLP